MQWGQSQKSSHNYTITFPITFKSSFRSGSATFSDVYGDRLYCACLSEPTISTMKISTEGTNKVVYWLAFGIQQQWGWWDNTKGTLVVTYPISFQTSNCKVICSGINVGTVNMHISSSPSPSQTGCSLATNNSSYWVSAYWIAVGIQQWSVNGQPLSGSYGTWSFPIAFSSTNYWTYATWHDRTSRAGNYYGFPTTGTKTKTSCAYVIDSVNVDVFAIGIQQWGYSSSGRSVTFPITFPHFIFAALGTPDTDYTSATATGVHTLTLSNMGYVMHGSKGWWIALGKQQWGVNYCTATSITSNLPLTISTALAAVCSNFQKDGAVRVGVENVSTTTIRCKLINAESNKLGASNPFCWILLAI